MPYSGQVGVEDRKRSKTLVLLFFLDPVCLIRETGSVFESETEQKNSSSKERIPNYLLDMRALRPTTILTHQHTYQENFYEETDRPNRVN